MAENTVQSTKFYLTARAGEQLPQKPVKFQPSNESGSSNPFAFGEYISTVEQDNVDDKNLSEAYKSSAVAGFTLKKSSAVTDFNAYMRKVQLNQKLNSKLG